MWDLFQRLGDLSLSPTPVASHLSAAQAADLHPGALEASGWWRGGVSGMRMDVSDGTEVN